MFKTFVSLLSGHASYIICHYPASRSVWWRTEWRSHKSFGF